jgi:integrase
MEVVEMGFVEKRSGNYRVRYRDPAGKLTSRTFKRKVDADRFLREMEVDVARGVWIDPRGADTSLAAWAEEFLSLARRLAPSTQDTYQRDLEKFVLPRFGSYRLGRLPAAEIENWLNDEVERGIAPSSVHRHYRVLRRTLQVAVDKQRLLFNPCDRVEPPRVPKREMLFLDWGQAVDLAEAHSARYQALIYTAVDTGMRWSELVGLRRARLDLAHGKVRVTEQLMRTAAGHWMRKGPKTPASVRSISLSPFTTELLSEHVGRFSGAGPDGLVFANGAANPIAASSFWNNHFSRSLRRAGVSCRFHDLRHTSVALAIAEGAHPKAIQARMGHSSITVTLDRYGHLFPELDEAIASAFSARFVEAHARHRLGDEAATPRALMVLR